MNLVILSGRATDDAKVNEKVARYSLAVDRFGKATDFINCVTFDEKGIAFAQKFIKKGTKLIVEGRIQTGSYEKDGQKVRTTDVVVNRHEFAESKSSQAEPVAPPDFMSIPEGIETDLPFN